MKSPAGRNPPYTSEKSGRSRKMRCWLRACGSSLGVCIMRVWTSWSNAEMIASTLRPNPKTENRTCAWCASRLKSHGTIGLMHGTLGLPGCWQTTVITGCPNTCSIELMSGAERPPL